MGNKQAGKAGTKTYEDIHTGHRHKRGVPRTGEGSDVDPFPHPFSRTHSRSFSVHTARTQRAYLGSLTCPANAGNSTGFRDDYVSVKKTFESDDHWLPSDLFVSHVIGDVKRADAYVSCSHDAPLLPSPDARRGILKSPRIQGRKEMCLDLVSPVSFGDSFPYHSMNCSERLRKMEQSSSASDDTVIKRPVRYDIVGSAQLQRKVSTSRTQCGAVSDGHYSPEHGRRDMLPYEARSRQSVVRKMSAPCQSSYRKDSESRKRILQEEARSKSAHNSPVITRKALPSHGSLVIVKRTPSRGPSVERRFPVNASESYVLSGGFGGESSDSSDVSVSRQHTSLFGRQQGRSVCDRVSKQQTLAASLAMSPRSPQTFRKISDSPLLFLTEKDHHSTAVSERDGRGRAGRDCKMSQQRSRAQISTEGNRKGVTQTSASSSSLSKTPEGTSYREDSSSKQSPLSTGPHIPSQVSSPPRGSPVKYYTIPSASSAAELDEIHEGLASRLKPSSTTVNSRTTEMTEGGGKSHWSEEERKTSRTKNAEDQRNDPGEVVTEDTIRENTQNAVFGSISPKLKRLRHSSGHRLRCHSTSSSSSSAPSRHACSERIPSSKCVMTSGTTTQNDSSIKSASTIRTVPSTGICNTYFTTATACDKRFESPPCVSMSLPSQSVLSAHCLTTDRDIFSESRAKNLGQIIRDVINESTSGKTTKDDTTHARHDVRVDAHTKRWTSSQRYHRHYTLPSTELQKPCVIHNTFSQRTHTDTGKSCAFDTSMQFGSKEQHYLVNDNKVNARDSQSDSSTSVYPPDLTKETDTFQFKSDLERKQLYDSTDMVSDDMNRSYEGRLSEYGFLGSPKGLVTSDTTDTFSTDRETSASSKRESSTSTATDDTLTSFKTRSTADSVELEETFVLKESLVFVRTDHDAGDSGLLAGNVSGQTVNRQNCTIGAPPPDSSCATSRSLSHKPRKKRRRQMVESDDMNSSTDNLDCVPKRAYDRSNIFRADHSDDSDLLTTEDDARQDEVLQKKKYTFLITDRQQKSIPECVHRQDSSSRHMTPRSANRDERSSSDSSDTGSNHLVHKGRGSSAHTTARTFPETGHSSDQEETDLTTTLDELEEEDSDDRTDTLTVFPTSPDHSRRRHSPLSPRSTDLDYDLEYDDGVSTDLTKSDVDYDNDKSACSFGSNKENERKATKGKALVYEKSCPEDYNNKVVFPYTFYNSTYNND